MAADMPALGLEAASVLVKGLVVGCDPRLPSHPKELKLGQNSLEILLSIFSTLHLRLKFNSNIIKNFLNSIRLSVLDISVTYENGTASMWFNPHCGVYNNFFVFLRPIAIISPSETISQPD